MEPLKKEIRELLVFKGIPRENKSLKINKKKETKKKRENRIERIQKETRIFPCGKVQTKIEVLLKK